VQEFTMKTHLTLFAAALAATVTFASVADAREGRVRARGENGVATAGAGPNGGAIVRGRGAVENPDGSVTAGSAGAFRGPNGAKGVRGSTTTVNPDGSATRRGGFAASGENGSVQSSGSSSRSTDGSYTGQRSTTATSANTGNTYNSTTTYDPATGVNRTVTCTNASGAAIACPR
jgi:hypothetical protein